MAMTWLAPSLVATTLGAAHVGDLYLVQMKIDLGVKYEMAPMPRYSIVV